MNRAGIFLVYEQPWQKKTSTLKMEQLISVAILQSRRKQEPGKRVPISLVLPFQTFYPSLLWNVINGKSRDSLEWYMFWILTGNECCERLAYYGINTNLVNYLKFQLNQRNVVAINNVTNWSGTCYVTPLLGAFLADAYLGRYWTIAGFSIIYVFVSLVKQSFVIHLNFGWILINVFIFLRRSKNSLACFIRGWHC